MRSSVKEALRPYLLQEQPIGRSGEPAYWVEAKRLLDAARALRAHEQLQIEWVENLSAIQMSGAIVLSYWIRSSKHDESVLVRLSVVPSDADSWVTCASVADVWPSAKAFESEIRQLFGVHFEGAQDAGFSIHVHLLPEGWKGFPLRKQYVFPNEFGGISHFRPPLHEKGGHA